MNYNIIRPNKQNDNLAKFDEVLLNLAQADSIKIHFTDNSSHTDLNGLEDQAGELVEKMKRTFRQLNSFLMTQDESQELKNSFRNFQAFESWYKLTKKRNDKASATNRKPHQNADSLNKSDFDDEHGSICDSVEFKDSLENHNDSLYKITNGIKKLKTSSDIETLDESLPHGVYGIKTSGATTTIKKKIKKPVVVIRARKSKSSYPTQYGKSSLLKNESDFESYLSDQNYPSKSSIKSKAQTKPAQKLKVKIIDKNDAYVTDSFKATQFAMPKKATTKPCLTLHLVKDEELIPLRKFSNDFWENFSSEHFAASDFFE